MTKPAIDQMDTGTGDQMNLGQIGLGIDAIGVALMALREDRWRDEKTILFVRNAIGRGLEALAPLRDLMAEMADAREALDVTRH
jgi:hypothetical protein